MNSTLFRIHGFRFYFYEVETGRMHVHVSAPPEGSAKIWLEPHLELASAANLTERQLRDLMKIARARAHDLTQAWQRKHSPKSPAPPPASPFP
ncbi:MAG: DUF4160 domain-containing protein [Lentisphaerae bacterium]|nr:DUF4160 domain-containing protein [Lentisphaerota bacterium]